MIYGQPVTFGGSSGGGSAPVLLWTNASPTSHFGAQTVSVDGSAYNAYLVEVQFSTSSAGSTGIAFVSKGTFNQTAGAALRGVAATASASSYRFITSADDNGISFGYSYYGNSTGWSADSAIPTRIWGVNFTL